MIIRLKQVQMQAQKSDVINTEESLLKLWPTSNCHQSLMQVCYKI